MAISIGNTGCINIVCRIFLPVGSTALFFLLKFVKSFLVKSCCLSSCSSTISWWKFSHLWNERKWWITMITTASMEARWLPNFWYIKIKSILQWIVSSNIFGYTLSPRWFNYRLLLWLLLSSHCWSLLLHSRLYLRLLLLLSIRLRLLLLLLLLMWTYIWRSIARFNLRHATELRWRYSSTSTATALSFLKLRLRLAAASTWLMLMKWWCRVK